MEKINNKGYMLVEIIVASTIAMVIAYFLINVTIKIKDSNTDAYIDTILLTDKMIMTSQIMNDVINYDILKVETTTNSVSITYNIDSRETTKTLSYDKNTKTLSYGDYKKKFNDKLNVNNINIEKNTTNGYLKIKIPAYTLYSDFDYGLDLFIVYD